MVVVAIDSRRGFVGRRRGEQWRERRAQSGIAGSLQLQLQWATTRRGRRFAIDAIDIDFYFDSVSVSLVQFDWPIEALAADSTYYYLGGELPLLTYLLFVPLTNAVAVASLLKSPLLPSEPFC